jgi:UDP:flavonoid glycosyltransferase YjiC (YdhE family)
MRHQILLASMASAGHVYPLRPIARALVRRGHSVRWYTGERFRSAVEETGARFAAMSYDHDTPDASRPDPPKRSGLDGMRHAIKHVFLDPAPDQAVDLRCLADEERVDALVAEFGVLGARMFHELTGVPWVSVGVSPLMMPSRDVAPFGLALPPAANALSRARYGLLNTYLDRIAFRDVHAHENGLRARLGLPPARGAFLDGVTSPLLHLQNGVSELEYPRRDLPGQVHFVGALVDPPHRDQPPAWYADVERATVPVVHVTQGTVADVELEALVKPTIRALAGEEVLVVAGTGRHDPATLGRLPDNVRVAPYIPHGWLLAHTAVMVTNGGYGGVQAALSHGVPLVVAGASEDKPEVAARVAWAGAGVDLRTGDPTEARIRDAVREVLATARYRQRATALRDAYAKFDAGQASADLIEALADTRLPVTRAWRR